jgi:hypothetical protein
MRFQTAYSKGEIIRKHANARPLNPPQGDFLIFYILQVPLRGI